MIKRIILIILPALIIPVSGFAQKWSVSTNIASWADLATVNAEASLATGRHSSVGIGVKYNPWTFGSGETQMQDKQATAYVCGRWWPWNVYSGWWLGGKGQYTQYNHGGIFRRETEEGDAYGIGLMGGYTLMLHKSLNMDFGLGLWGGYTRYKVFACPKCGKIVRDGDKWFLMPNDLILSLVYVF